MIDNVKSQILFLSSQRTEDCVCIKDDSAIFHDYSKIWILLLHYCLFFQFFVNACVPYSSPFGCNIALRTEENDSQRVELVLRASLDMVGSSGRAV